MSLIQYQTLTSQLLGQRGSGDAGGRNITYRRFLYYTQRVNPDDRLVGTPFDENMCLEQRHQQVTNQEENGGRQENYDYPLS